jgi:hypothetical protein
MTSTEKLLARASGTFGRILKQMENGLEGGIVFFAASQSCLLDAFNYRSRQPIKHGIHLKPRQIKSGYAI